MGRGESRLQRHGGRLRSWAGLALEGLDGWRHAVEPHLLGLERPVLDLGAGTGSRTKEFADGMATLDHAIASGEAPGPVVDYLDLLVLRKG